MTDRRELIERLIAENIPGTRGVAASAVADVIVDHLNLDEPVTQDPNANIGTPSLAEAIDNVVTQVAGPIVSAVRDHRDLLTSQGFSEEAANQGALQFHALLLNMLGMGMR